jgi:2-phosphosulfolactate phosphatase
VKIDVFFTPFALGASDLGGRTVVVVDVLRATTTIAVALANGAKAVLPAGTTEEALRIAQNLERDAVILAGERKSERIPGFALGNSPTEFGPQVVGGKTIVMSTTNGTGAFVAAQAAREVIACAAVNFSTVVERCRTVLAERGDLVILCAGAEKQFALEDGFAAGRLAKLLLPEGGARSVSINDGAVASLELARHYGERWGRALKASAHGRELAALGFRADLETCAAQDTHPVLPLYADRRITAYRPSSEG